MPPTRPGRPRLFPDGPASARVEVRVTADQHRALQQAAQQNCQTLSAFIRDAVNEAVADYGERQPFSPRRR